MRQESFNIVRRHLVVITPDNFDEADIAELEQRILEELKATRQTRGVIVDFTEVRSTDALALRRLGQCLQAIGLMGRRIALCGINPGLAAVMVQSGQELHHQLIGFDIDDVLHRLHDA